MLWLMWISHGHVSWPQTCSLTQKCRDRGERPSRARAEGPRLRKLHLSVFIRSQLPMIPRGPAPPFCRGTSHPADPARPRGSPGAAQPSLTLKRSMSGPSQNSASSFQGKEARARAACRGPRGRSGSRGSSLPSPRGTIAPTTCTDT